jgi:hypothetical protein
MGDRTESSVDLTVKVVKRHHFGMHTEKMIGTSLWFARISERSNRSSYVWFPKLISCISNS